MRKIITVYIDKKYVINSSSNSEKKTNEDITMNFQEAVKAAKSGETLTLPSWNKGMKMWWQNEVLLHSHPYNTLQRTFPGALGYAYVCEKDDAFSQDWSVIKEND